MSAGVAARWLVAAILLLALLLLFPIAAAAAPAAVSVTPNTGAGSSQTFAFLYSDSGGVGRLSYVQALINASNSWRNACAILYIQSSNGLYLVNDAGNGWQGPLTPGQAGTLQNSQCTLDAGASSVSKVGNNLTVNAALAFKPAFGGNKVVLLDAEDTVNKLSSGFQNLGTWTVPFRPPTAVSVTPSSGTGSSQTFAFLYSDANGVNRITYVQALVNTTNSWRNACAILYMQSNNGLYLVNDAGNGWQGPLTPGQAGTLQNNQCTLDAAASSVSKVGNNLTVNAALTFKPSFGGNKIVLLDAEDTANKLSSGWQNRGTWTVPNSAPVAVSVTPSSGAGSSQTFAFLYSDAGGTGRITYVQALINASNSWWKACAILYIQSGNGLYLVNDAGNGWQGPLTPGQAGTLQNSQCTLDSGASSVSKVGNNLTVNAALTFKPAFGGNKVVLLDAEDTVNKLSSGFQSLGTWTVPNPTPVISSISPTSIPALSGDTLLTVNGSSFLASSVVELSGLSLATTFQGSSQLTATIPASMLSDPGTVPITVMTPGGGVSNTKNLTIAQAVTVSPSTRTVPINWTRLFTATVAGESDQSVTWQVNDVTGGDATTGTITAAGIYLSPGTVPGDNVVTVKAVSVANPNKFGTAVVTITLPPSDNYPRSDASSVLRSQPPLLQVPLTGTLVAVLDWTAKDSSANQEDVLAACHSLNEMGIPHVHATDLTTAAGYPFVVVAGVLEQNAVNNPERDALAAYVQGGGTLLLWRPSDTGVLSRLGVTASSSFSGTSVRSVTFDTSTGDPVMRYIDDDAEVHWQMTYPPTGHTREYTAGSATVLATWTSGLGAVLRSDLGTGRAYIFGWRLRNVLTDGERQVIPGAEPPWTNELTIDADIVRLLQRGIYEGRASDPQVRPFAPDGKPAALILTHDIDAATSYTLTPTFVQIEQGHSVKATYLFTTSPFNTGWVGTLYDLTTRQSVQAAVDAGFDVESHSIGHFNDYNLAPLGTGTEDASNYFPHYSADLGQTIGMSAIGEAGVSRWLLERDFPITVEGFRTGYLLQPAAHLESVRQAGYRRDSTYAAGVVRGYAPFVPFTASGGTVTTYPFVEYPYGLGDSNPSLDADTLEEIVGKWETVIRTNYKNGVPTVINIHPVNDVKRQAEELLLQRISDLNLWIGDWKTFGNFWESQGVTCSRWP